jgi:hypothetical protein
MLVYVDDIIVVSSCANALLKELSEKFSLKNHGDLHFFLAIEVQKIDDVILLNQAKTMPKMF